VEYLNIHLKNII